MDPTRGDSRYNLNYSMSSIGLSLADQADMYGNPAAVAALGARPPSGGLIQSMGGGGGVGGFGSAARGGLMVPTQQHPAQCQASALGNATGNSAGQQQQQQPQQQQQQHQQQQQQRGIKRSGSDCYEDHQRGGGMSAQTLQALENCSSAGAQQQHQQQQQQGGGLGGEVVDDNYNALQSKKSPPANGKKTKGRVKIKMEYIDNKLRRYTTFSKRKTGIMKKAYELSTLTGTQVMLLVASETGHVYTFATRKLQPMITSEAGKQLIQTCLNSPDPPSAVGGGDQRMSATGFEETELSYNIADEDSKDERSPLSSGNETDDSSDVDSPVPPAPTQSTAAAATPTVALNCTKSAMDAAAAKGVANGVTTDLAAAAKCVAPQAPPAHFKLEPSSSNSSGAAATLVKPVPPLLPTQPSGDSLLYPATALANIAPDVLRQLIQSGHLQLHTEEDGSGHQYVAIPLSSATAKLLQASQSLKNNAMPAATSGPAAGGTATTAGGLVIKQELD